MTRDAVIVSTARTPIGRAYRGVFNATPAPTLAAEDLPGAGLAPRRQLGAMRPTGAACLRNCLVYSTTK